MHIFEGFQRGINLGGWISQYAAYDTKHFDTFITEKDIAYIASLGFDHVRVPVDYPVLEDEDGTPRDGGFAYLINCRDWCVKHGLHMIIDLHECYGYSFDPLKKDMDRKIFFYDDALQARFLKLWKRIAETFRNDADVIAFEPLNEVVEYSVHEAWNKVVEKYVDVIRSVCPKHYIVIGGVCYNSVRTVKLLGKPHDDHIVYNFHCYEPVIFTHQGAYWVDKMPPDFRIGYPLPLEEYREASRMLNRNLASFIFEEDVGETGTAFFESLFKPALEYAAEMDVPLYCGEYGVIDLADNHDKINWLKDIHQVFKAHGIGRSLWNYKEKDFGLVDEAFASVKDEFIACL